MRESGNLLLQSGELLLLLLHECSQLMLCGSRHRREGNGRERDGGGATLRDDGERTEAQWLRDGGDRVDLETKCDRRVCVTRAAADGRCKDG